jgi:hypothetical protein
MRTNNPSAPEPANDQPKEQTSPASTPNELALVQLRDTMAKFDLVRFRSLLDLFKSIPSAVQSPSGKHAADIYKDQMTLQK